MVFNSIIPSTHEFVMCDARQERMFAALGHSRQLFSQAATWPLLDEQLSSMARQFIDQHGEDAWMSAGGIRDQNDGRPSFRSSSGIVGGIVKQIASQYGGLRYADESGQSWAIRLLPNRTSPKEEYLGVAVTMCDSIVLPDHDRANGMRSLPGGIAEQLLWSVFLAVREQRSSLVVIPDTQLRQVIWGGHDHPANWRRYIFDALRSLRHVHFEVFHLAGGGWRPKIDASGVAIASVVKRERGKPSSFCDVLGCPLMGTTVPHGHFLVECGRCFLGALELFAQEGSVSGRTYDFLTLPTNKAKQKQYAAAKSAGHLISVHIPTKLYASARWSDFTVLQRGILNGLLREITRGGKSPRVDRAAVFMGRAVAGKKPVDTLPCPLLGPDDSYVVFGGNGKRRGLGYCIIGAKGRGWLAKCGLELPQNADRHRRAVKKFLRDLAVVGEIIGVTLVGFDPKTSQWHSFDAMLAMTSNEPAFEPLLRLWLRPYAPTDYHRRLGGYYEERGQLRAGAYRYDAPRSPAARTGQVEAPSLSLISATSSGGTDGNSELPGGHVVVARGASTMLNGNPGVADGTFVNDGSLLSQVRQLGLTQAQLAEQVRCSPQYVSQLFCARRRISPRIRQAFERLVAAGLGT